jgi:hypothetical protein
MQSPSVRKRRAPEAFSTCCDTEELLAGAVVGTLRFVPVMLAYRLTSRRFLSAVDASIDEWCARVRAMQAEYNALRILLDDKAFRVLVELEAVVRRGLGKDVVSTVVGLSKLDRVTYFAALARRCVLCDSKLVLSSVEDAEQTRHTPRYAFAHDACQRKHMVEIGTSGVNVAREPRELHRELHCVAQHLKQEEDFSICRSTVLSSLSPWCNVHCKRESNHAPLLLWMRPHARVSHRDTLYGALVIDKGLVDDAFARQRVHMQLLKEQAAARRMSVVRRTSDLNAAYEAELRVWLGKKRRTRWSSLSDLDALHEEIRASLRMDSLTDTHRRGGVTLQSLCNTLQFFSRTLDLVDGGISPAVLDWLIRCPTVNAVFGGETAQMIFADPETRDTALECEAQIYAQALGLLQNIPGDAVTDVRVQPQSAIFGLEPAFNVSIVVDASDVLTFAKHSVMSASRIAKLKFLAENAGATRLPRFLPDMKTPDMVAAYLKTILCACLSSGAGMARSVALEHLITHDMFRELLATSTGAG